MNGVCSTIISLKLISPPGQNGRLFADDIFICIFMNEKFCILVKISLKFVSKGPIDSNPALVQIMAWRRIGANYLNQCWPSSLTHICGTRGDELTSLGWHRQSQCYKTYDMTCRAPVAFGINPKAGVQVSLGSRRFLSQELRNSFRESRLPEIYLLTGVNP